MKKTTWFDVHILTTEGPTHCWQWSADNRCNTSPMPTHPMCTCQLSVIYISNTKLGLDLTETEQFDNHLTHYAGTDRLVHVLHVYWYRGMCWCLNNSCTATHPSRWAWIKVSSRSRTNVFRLTTTAGQRDKGTVWWSVRQVHMCVYRCMHAHLTWVVSKSHNTQ